jgi:hypothetical protein
MMIHHILDTAVARPGLKIASFMSLHADGTVLSLDLTLRYATVLTSPRLRSGDHQAGMQLRSGVQGGGKATRDEEEGVVELRA